MPLDDLQSGEARSQMEATPNHLFLLKRQPVLPRGLFQREDLYARKRWKQVQYLSDIFWKRWTKEYLPLLQERQKQTEIRRNLREGDVVLIVDDSAPRCSWWMGKSEKTVPDAKGLVRCVFVKSKSSVLERPDKLCLLLEMDVSKLITMCAIRLCLRHVIYDVIIELICYMFTLSIVLI